MFPLGKKLVCLFAVSLIWTAGSGALAPEKKTALKIATFMDFPPFIADTEPDGGILSVIVTESFRAAGIEPVYSLLPWRRSYRAVMRGEYTASYSWAYSEERARDFELSEPIFAISNQLLTTYSDLENWQQLKEARADGTIPILCVPIGWKVAEEIETLIAQKKIRQMAPGRPRYCMDLIRANRTNIIYMPRMTASYHLNAIKSEETGQNARPWPELYSMAVPNGIANTQHVIFTKSPEGAALKARFDAGFTQLVASGRYQEILTRYLESYSQADRKAVYREQINAGILPQE